MKNISAQLKSEIQNGTICSCVKVETHDGDVFGFTNHDLPLTIDNVTYSPSPGLERIILNMRSNSEVSNQEFVSAWVMDLPEESLIAGKFDNATISVFKVSWNDVSAGTVSVFEGTLGLVQWSDDGFRADVVSSMKQLSKPIGQLVSPDCRHELFSQPETGKVGSCGLTSTSYTNLASVDAVNVQKLSFDVKDRMNLAEVPPPSSPQAVWASPSNWLDYIGNSSVGETTEGTLAFWVNRFSTYGTDIIQVSNSGGLFAKFTEDNRIEFTALRNGNRLTYGITSYTFNLNTWYSVVFSWKSLPGELELQCSVNGEQIGFEHHNYYIVAGTINFFGNTSVSIPPRSGYLVDSSPMSPFTGRLSEVWFDTNYLDLSIQSNREKFVKNGYPPTNLGSSGQNVTGTVPLIYHSGPAADWNSGNLGSATTTYTDNQNLLDANLTEPVIAPNAQLPYDFEPVPSTPTSSGYFANGTLKWLSGNNAGTSSVIKGWNGTTETVELFLPTAFTIQPNDQFELLPGCDKTTNDCKNKFNNIENFGGFPHITNEINFK